jgi:hypothetical protein
MAMEIQYTSLAPTTRTVNLSEEDMAALYDIVVNYFLGMLPHLEMNDKTLAWDANRKAIRDYADKYGVAWDHPASLAAFYRAALGKTTNTEKSLETSI